MVNKEAKSSISEDDGESQITNENGKRSLDDSNPVAKKRLKTKSLYRQPTVKELNRLQETENLFNSNLFRLQVDEVIQEVKTKEKTEKKINQWFADLKTHLMSIPEDETEYDLTEPNISKKLKVKIPINNDLKKTKCVFKFHKFSDVEIVGSYALNCSINSKLRVDIQITVPAETYTKNDSINYRYHKKRAAYLAFIASHLNKFQSIEKLSYTVLNGCNNKPVLDIKPMGKLANHFVARIDLCCEPEAYKFHRFGPQRNNLRESWLLSEQLSENNTEIGPPTPYYNSSVLTDITAHENNKYLKQMLLNTENLKQAVVLLKIWLRQRKLQVSGHVVSLYVAYLVQMRRINNIMSSYQIVRNVWIALKTSEWDTKGISLHKESDSPPIEEFLQHFPVVFLDITGYYNVAWNMCKGTYDALKRECTLAVEMLDNGTINSFIPLFMVPVTPLLQFDHILKFKNLPALKASVLSKASKESRVNYGLDELSLVTESVHALLCKGLGNRADLILQMVEADLSWPVKKTLEKAKSDGYEEKLSFGIILNPENALNIVLKGPPANLPEAEQFRLFWGDKSELRRFQDGSITETCVWEGDSLAEQRTVTHQIVEYLLQLKYATPPTALFHAGSQLDCLLSRKARADEAEEGCLRALQAFDALRRDLRALTQLPLDVSAVYGVSPVFSYCEPLPPPPAGAPRNPWRRGACALVKPIERTEGAVVPEYMAVCRAVVELGHSGKWPADLEAFRCLKAAFHLQLAQRLTAQHSIPTQTYPTHVDVLKNGLVFRLAIAHPKEITLLRKNMQNGVAKYNETEESVSLQKETVLMPRLRGALHGLHQKHSAFGPTACLFKRWLASHLLSPPHFPTTVAELLTAAVFVHPAPLAPPTMPTVGLLRVLRLLAETDWTRELLVLDFNGDLKPEDRSQLEKPFATRDVTTQPLYIATSYDGDLPSVWSSGAPTVPVVARAQALATSALGYFSESLLNKMADNVLAAFVPSLSGYDAIIRVRPHLVPHHRERVDRPPARVAPPTELAEEIIPVVEFDPVGRYLAELRSAYSEFALFFHDCYGGDVIAVLWKPDIDEMREFQLTNANALMPVKVEGEQKYKVNKAALLEDFKILGEGLVSEITVNTS